MNFLQRRKPTPSVPILPLIDILTILLIFFVVTTQFKKKKHMLEIELPKSNGQSVTMQVLDNAVIAISKEGQYSLNNVQMPQNELVFYLKTYKEENPEAKFIIEQDKGTGEEYEVYAVDALTEAGFKHISKRVLLGDEKQ